MDVYQPLTSDNTFVAAVRAMWEEDHGLRLPDAGTPRSSSTAIPAQSAQSNVLQTGFPLVPGPPPRPLQGAVEQQIQQEAPTETVSDQQQATEADRGPIVAMRNAVQFGVPLLLVNGADTLVYIDPAPRTGASMSPSIPLRVRSESLLRTGSSFFKDRFEPRRQARVLKSRGLTEDLPEGIHYVLDLTPALEDDDAVIYLTELSCPEGIRTWGRNQKRFNLPIDCVGGQEDLGKHPTQRSSAYQISRVNQAPTFTSASGRGSAPAVSCNRETGAQDGIAVQEADLRLPLDYSPIRHRSCIERIFHALEGLNPKLDTAPKMWTFFALSKIMGVANEEDIRNHILSWIYASQNTLFMELNPEAAYRVACGIRSSSLCRETFAILVGEEALLLLAGSKKDTPKRRDRTLHGRSRETIEDEELQRIEYASKNFMERILASFVELVGTRMAWVLGLDEYQRFITTASGLMDAAAIFNLNVKLKRFIRSRIYSMLTPYRSTYAPTSRQISGTYLGDYPQPNYWETYYNLTGLERVFSRTFWQSLLEDHLSSGENRLYGPHLCIADLGRHLPALKSQEAATCEPISMEEVRIAATLVNRGDRGYHIDGEVYCFDLSKCIAQANEYIRGFARRMMQPPHSNCGPFELVDTLTCLNEEEYRYLPLWAGGNDDGTGGVFTDHNIPIVEQGGFSAPGPGIHTGSTAASSESFSIVDSEGVSTAKVASHQATDGHDADVLSMGSVRDSLWEDVLARRDNSRATQAESLASWDNPIVSEEFNEGSLTDIASDESGTIIVGSPSLVDPLNDNEELDLEEGDPLDFSDEDDRDD
ncbi:hypothetical protein DTO027B5_6909 [Paecilomyces variotii]|nr:hypothetical protein DTO195F2_6364 [Paecilomyces variotii]KAJ9321682.1 hypothetical protein DTO027B3_7330 [Paecilomyces variotii]KAJ9331349.1 hypothetical protein DTO027B5_6909 [Paecilomyces variotii]KAJ9367429.1 hypothetical protein DTO282E5_7881 [Paecilomyces variotii]KAJ9395550.1 hypothetical protein DTO282F9_7507 [Paecilomyces variotii]